MKIGEIKRDINVQLGTAKSLFGDYTERALVKEGIRLFDKHPEYKYLKDDPYIEWFKDPSLPLVDNERIYKSVVYAYMVDQILIKHPEFNENYKRIVQESINREKDNGIKEFKGKEELTYSSFNNRFLRWYDDYLREQADPGCLERERIEYEKKQQAFKDAQRIRQFEEHQQEQQDLASGKRVVCPYCKSTNTEKISTMSRAVSVSLVGAASGKIGKQWHCKQCGSNF